MPGHPLGRLVPAGREPVGLPKEKAVTTGGRRWRPWALLVAGALVGCVSQDLYEKEVQRVEELQGALQVQSADLGAKLAEADRRIQALEEELRRREKVLADLTEARHSQQTRYQTALKRIDELNVMRTQNRDRILQLEAEAAIMKRLLRKSQGEPGAAQGARERGQSGPEKPSPALP